MNKGTGENGIPQRVAARVLACVQGMDLDPVLAAELGLETLKRAEKSAGKDEESVLKTAMRELDALLAERGVAREPDVSRGRLDSAPPMNRRNMLAEEMDITPLRSAIKRLFRRQRAAHPWSSGPGAGGRFPWRVSATLRRLVLLALIVIPTAISASIMHSLLPTGGYHALRVIITALFAVLFAWISVGFWSSVAGLAMLFTRSDRFALARL